MKSSVFKLSTCLSLVCLALSQTATAAVSPAEAEQLKTTLTPLGGEKAGNKEGTIPAWTGGYTTPIAGFKNGGRRTDPFASDKVLYTVNAKNMDKYAALLSDGVKAMLKKYPDTYHLNVYQTRRTAAAPEFVYANTFKNATKGKLIENDKGAVPENVEGGIPFPIPKSGAEVLWNHQLRWRGTSVSFDMQGWLSTAEGKNILTVDGTADIQMPYYGKEGELEKAGNDYWLFRLINAGPPIRAGEGIVVRNNMNGSEQSWVYLTGQRRVRRIPNLCCDQPTPATAGAMGVDDIEIFSGPNGRFDWKLVGKKEMLIPYNNNKIFEPTKVSDVLTGRHVNSEVMRWELHRVWVVETSLKAGKRHQAPKSMYYFDEDTWNAVLGDRWDGGGQLWKTSWMASVVMPDIPATATTVFGYNDLISGTSYTNTLVNEKSMHYKVMPKYSDATFTGDGLVGDSLR